MAKLDKHFFLWIYLNVTCDQQCESYSCFSNKKKLIPDNFLSYFIQQIFLKKSQFKILNYFSRRKEFFS